jgi:hypothetical protein
MNRSFLVVVKYTKQLENGTFKRVAEPYLLFAYSFTDAEARIYEELGPIIKGEFIVDSIKRFTLQDIFLFEDSETWYKLKISYKSEADGAEKPKKITQVYLLTAHSTKDAFDRLKESLSGLMVDFEIVRVEKTNIVEVFPFAENETTEERVERVINDEDDLSFVDKMEGAK